MARSMANLSYSALARWIAPQPIFQFHECYRMQQIRTVWVLKRRHELPPPHPLHADEKRKPTEKQKIFDIVEVTHRQKQPPIELLLLQDVPGLGKAGDIASVPRRLGRMRLIPEKKAVYVTEDALATFEELRKSGQRKEWSSPFAMSTVAFLACRVQNVQLSSQNPWKLEKHHIRSALRRSGVWCPESSIDLPTEEISGPDPEMHGKCFSVFITINGKEKAHLLCRIQLLSKERVSPFPDLPQLILKKAEERRAAALEPLYPNAISEQFYAEPDKQ